MDNVIALRYVIIGILVISATVVIPNLAYSEKPFTVKLDKEDYSIEETTHVCGTVPVVLENEPVIIQVFNPRNVMYAVGQQIPDADGRYSFDFKIGGKYGIGGTYAVKATYFGHNMQTTFFFEGLTATADGEKVEFGGMVFNLPMSLTNGNIKSYNINTNNTSIVFSISTCETEDGELRVSLPRELIDTRTDGQDLSFRVLRNEEETRFNETAKDSFYRTLVIPAPAGTEKIEIFGTHVIPEFPVSSVVLLTFIIGLISTSRLIHEKSYYGRGL